MRRAPKGVLCVAAAAVLTGAAIGVPSSTGCYTHQCDSPPPTTYDRGEMVDENTYETSPIEQPDSGVGSDEPWIPYPGNSTVTVTFPDAGRSGARRVPYDVVPYVGVTAQPDLPDANFIVAAGALAEINNVTPEGFTVVNNTCGSYFARFVVHFPALDGSSGP